MSSAAPIPPRLDELTYPGGHVWKRHRQHEQMVLAVKQRLEDAANAAAVAHVSNVTALPVRARRVA